MALREGTELIYGIPANMVGSHCLGWKAIYMLAYIKAKNDYKYTGAYTIYLLVWFK